MLPPYVSASVLIISIDFPPELLLHVGSNVLSPMRLALTASAGVMMCGFFQGWQLLAAQMAACALMAAALGNTPGEITRHSFALAKSVYHALKRLIPETPMQWGIVAVAASFVMLGIGAMLSLRKIPPEVAPPPEESAAT